MSKKKHARARGVQSSATSGAKRSKVRTDAGPAPREGRGRRSGQALGVLVCLEFSQEVTVAPAPKRPTTQKLSSPPEIELAHQDSIGPGSVRCQATRVRTRRTEDGVLMSRHLKVSVRLTDGERAISTLREIGIYRPEWFENLGARFGFNGDAFARRFLRGGHWLCGREDDARFAWVPKGTRLSIRTELVGVRLNPRSRPR